MTQTPYNPIHPMKLVVATGELLEQILDATYPVWHEGLTRAAYAQWNAAQMRTAWGAEHLHRFALVADSGALLSSAKRYRFPARVNGQRTTMCGLGAVFTPPAQRGRGYATAIVERLIDRERAAGAALAGLFSEIGTAFYERIGFQPLPIDELTVNVKMKGGAPAMLVRTGVDADLPALAAMHEARSAGSRLGILRNPALIQFALTKKRLLAGLGPEGLRQIEFHVAEEGGSAVAYVVLSVSEHGWTLDEAGDRDPNGARLGALLQVLIAREPSRPVPLIRTWWPRSFPVPPQLTLSHRRSARDVLMLRPLADVRLTDSPDDAFFWRSDFF